MQVVTCEESGTSKTASARIQINDPLRAEEINLRALVSHNHTVDANDSVELVMEVFARNKVDFIAIVDGAHLVGLCSHHRLSEVLGGRYGFALWARKPIGPHRSPNETRVSVSTPIGDVLKKVFARSDENFYDDVLLVDEAGSFLGLISTQTLFTVQNGLLRTNIRELIEREREIERKNEQMETDLRMALELQQALMPVTYPVFPANATAETIQLRFSHFYRPASLIGGDFFFIVRVSNSTAGIFICDVMGHGVRSALITSMLRAMIESLGPLAADPGELMLKLNTELISILHSTGTVLFVTAIYATLNVTNGELRFARAGHPYPLRIRRDREVEILNGDADRGGPALGLMPEARFHTSTVSLSPNDRIFLFTDGIIEANDRKESEFGIDGLVASIRKNFNCPDFLQSILVDANAFVGSTEFKDDVCLVTAQWMP